MSRHTNKQTVITYTAVSRLGCQEDSLVEPEHIEYEGAYWKAKLQDTFLIGEGESILAVWTLGTFIRDTPETQASQARGAAWHYRKSGEFNHAQYQEEIAIAIERDYPHIKTDGLAFKGLTIL